MKKILIAFDGPDFPESAFKFACRLNEMQPVLLTGVFIPQAIYASLWSVTSAVVDPVYATMVEDEDMLQKNIARFEALCTKNKIAFKVHKDFTDFALPQLKMETRFSDLLIIGSENYFHNVVGANHREYMKDAMHEAECPIMVIPEANIFPKYNIIAYDGSASSIFAMKQFAYLFPDLAANETLLIHYKNENDRKVPQRGYIEELAAQHFKKLTILNLEIEPIKYFATWIKKSDNPIIICGAYGRSYISQIFKKSFATEVITDLRLPVFIAHL